MPATLIDTHKMGPPWQHLTCWCTPSIHECLPLFQEDECCGKPDYHQDEVYLITAKVMGWWLFTSHTCRSKQICECLLFSCCWETGTPCQVTDQLRYRPHKAAPWSQRWMCSLCSKGCPVHRSCYGSALQIHIALGSSDGRPHGLLFCLTQKVCSHPGNCGAE